VLVTTQIIDSVVIFAFNVPALLVGRQRGIWECWPVKMPVKTEVASSTVSWTSERDLGMLACKNAS